jgi:hypothetical protein
VIVWASNDMDVLHNGVFGNAAGSGKPPQRFTRQSVSFITPERWP